MGWAFQSNIIVFLKKKWAKLLNISMLFPFPFPQEDIAEKEEESGTSMSSCHHHNSGLQTACRLMKDTLK